VTLDQYATWAGQHRREPVKGLSAEPLRLEIGLAFVREIGKSPER
jgi:hypothetical protein